jgi:hypothetical protein
MIEARISTERLHTVLGRIPSTVERLLADAQVEMAETHIEKMARRMRADGDGLVKTRTGFLRDRMVKEQRRFGGVGGLRTRVFVAGVKYADVQEFGGVIRPKNKKFLTVPMSEIKTAGGAIKGKYAGGAGAYRASGAKTFVWRNALGGAFIVEKTARGYLRLLWKLVKSVTLKPKLGWYSTWKKAEPERRAILDRVASNVVREATRP